MSDTPMVDDRLQFAEDVEGRQPVILASFARQLERENASLADRLSGAELERDRLGVELQDMKLYASYLEDNMSPEALRFAKAGFDIEKSRIPIAG